MAQALNHSLTDIEGIHVGHAQDIEAGTGCTVILCTGGATAGVDVRGGAPGTRETDLLRPGHLVQQVHAIMLTGGSAFGLDAASGVMRYLREQNVGFDVGVARIPLVPAAVIFDLGFLRSDVYPDAAMGYQACLNASSQAVVEGNVGAGCGAACGKVLGMGQAMKSGIGTASIELFDGVRVAALMVVNAFGDVIDEKGQILVGARLEPHPTAPFVNTMEVLKTPLGHLIFGSAKPASNTCIGVVVTNARLNKEEVNKVAQMAHNGLAKAVRPAHTMMDGDTIFSLATGELDCDVTIIGAFAAELVAEACRRATTQAAYLGGLPGLAG